AAPEILETMSDALLVLDQKGVIRLANTAASSFFGQPANQLVGRPVRELLSSGPLGEALAAFPAAAKLEQQEFSHLGGPDDRRAVNVAPPVSGDHDGAALGPVCVLRDVTATRQLEQQMRQAQKMDAIGQLAGGIAHDLNNILQVVVTNAEIVRLDQPQL